MLHGKSLIAGSLGSDSPRFFHAFDPANGRELEPEFHEATDAEADRALTASAEAFAHYRTVPGSVRAELLDAIAAGIEAIGPALLERAHAESGLPLTRLTGERARTCGQMRLFAQVVREGSWADARIDPAVPARQPAPRPDLRRILQPVGPVVVFGSSNFPLAFSVAGGDTASALAAGCTVLVKAHRAHPGTAELVGEAVAQAVKSCGLPPGVFSLLHGGGTTIGIAMVRHPATAAVGFTGSHAAGRALIDAAASRPCPIPVFAEMSSLNPVFLLPGAMRERGPAIADGLFASVTLGSGQFCTKPGLIFAVRGSETDRLLARLEELLGAAPATTMLTPGIRGAFLEARSKLRAASGVRTVFVSCSAEEAEHTAVRPSMAMADVRDFLANPSLATEAFGPFALVILAEKTADFAACATALEGQLTATLQTSPNDGELTRELIAVLEQKTGRVVFNGFPTGVEVCPAMNHGGPYPATSDVRFTSVGTAAMLRFARPICYQNVPDDLLPAGLRNANPLGLMRQVDGRLTRDAIL